MTSLMNSPKFYPDPKFANISVGYRVASGGSGDGDPNNDDTEAGVGPSESVYDNC